MNLIPSEQSENLNHILELVRGGKKEEAQTGLLEIIKSNPHHDLAWIMLADTLNRDDLRIEILKKCIKYNPHSQSARQVLAEIIKKNRKIRPLQEQQEASPRNQVQPEQISPIRYRLPIAIILRKLASSIFILLSIAFLTQTGLYLAYRGREGLPSPPLKTISAALVNTWQYLFHHPSAYLWHKESVPAIKVILELFINSAALLLASLFIAALIGGALGIIAARVKGRNIRPAILIASILGVSTPSFLLGMLLWVLNLQVARLMGTSKAPLPPTGFGWNAHMIMPVLVLAARPIAQIMQVTYINLTEIFKQDYMRTARASGLSQRLQLLKHALPNIFIPILTTLSTSLRFSLSSLPIVESFFLWPGIGLTLLQMIAIDQTSIVTDLILALGLLFLFINLLLEFIYPRLDPRIASESFQPEETALENESPFTLRKLNETIAGFLKFAQKKFQKRQFTTTHDTPKLPELPRIENGENILKYEQLPPISRWKNVRLALANLPFVVGTIMVLLLIGLVLFGSFIPMNHPYETHGIMKVEGVITAPPFKPSSTFPWGTDVIGRDIQALVLAGARQTLSLAALGMLARLVVGLMVGLASGWWQHSWLDRLVNFLVSIWAAFPATIFAMILILGIGIEKGIGVFILTLCIIGWGEFAQFVRSQVIQQKPQLYILAARATGARQLAILWRHIMPQLVPSLIVMSTLEMGAILMLLAELGFLNIFLGGGYKTEIGEVGKMVSVIYYFSDIPEWGALLSNIRNWWRSYPWLAWYPGILFFLSILAFNLWGEGLRRLLDEARINLRWIFSRYALAGGAILLVGFFWLLRSSTPIELYRSQALQFNAQNTVMDIEVLGSDQLHGRESGTGDAYLAAQYIASRMQEIGLFPAGDDDSYIQTLNAIRFHLKTTPQLAVVDDQGNRTYAFNYREDFVEYVDAGAPSEGGFGTLMGIAVSPGSSSTEEERLFFRYSDYAENILIIQERDINLIDIPECSGLLIIAEDNEFLTRKYLYPARQYGIRRKYYPMMLITKEIGELLLSTTGTNWAEFDLLAADLPPGQFTTTSPGIQAEMIIEGAQDNLQETHHNVIGYIPGAGAQMTGPSGAALDSNVILISAYYDGLGTDPDGTFYPGVNDNASGVAAMLEIARVLMESSYPPHKTVVFTAWTGGERRESFSVVNTMSAKRGFSNLNVENVIELSGMAGGSGQGMVVENGSSYRLTRLFEQAAGRMDVNVSNRGRGPHFGRTARPAFGARSALSLYLTWDGADVLAHTPADSIENIDYAKLQQSGQAVTLTVTMLSRETDY